MRFDPIVQLAGALANTEYKSRPATSIRNGATPGSQLVTLGGTATLAMQPYSITYTRVLDNYSWTKFGVFTLTRSQLTLPLATAALAMFLNQYEDVQASVAVNGTDLTLRSKDGGLTPQLTLLPAATLTLATSVVTPAVAPRPLLPGTVVGFSIDPASGEKLIVPVGSADFSALNAGVVIQPLTPINRMRAENVTYDVLVDGTIWMNLVGTAPIVPATSAIQIGHAGSTTPGQIGVTGLTVGQFTTVNLMQSNGTLSRFNILDKNVPVGGRFRLEIR